MRKLIGPFTQLLTMRGLPNRGPIDDDQLEIILDGAILTEGSIIKAVGTFEQLYKEFGKGSSDSTQTSNLTVESPPAGQPWVAMPGLIDAHTHLCFAGSRAKDYALRVSGASYLDILAQGGGIHDSVRATRAASTNQLVEAIRTRARRHLAEGVTTIEVKTGYALDNDEEIRQLRAIHAAATQSCSDPRSENAQNASNFTQIHTSNSSQSHINLTPNDLPTLIPTSLAAHAVPEGTTAKEYLDHLIHDLLPRLKAQNLTHRIDIFVEKEAFPAQVAQPFTTAARNLGFDLTIHAEQFTTGGVELATTAGARSADHLEAITPENIKLLAASNTVATALPGASMGLGLPFAPGRQLLDAGAILAVATDWNPGSAPMGNLLLQAAVYGATQKLTMAETLAAITTRAAQALNLIHQSLSPDSTESFSIKGLLVPNADADLVTFPTDDYREILYHQGRLIPSLVWISSNRIDS